MAPNDKAGRVVFIGNIPYGITEEQIIDILKRVGQVLNFRLVYDKETGRPKGFGFAEFADGDAAASAVRNLNEHEIMGRKLRVDWSNDNGAGDNAPTTYSAPAVPTNGQPDLAVPQQSSVLPPLPPGSELPPNFTCPDAISRTLSTLPPPQLLDILSQMKGLVMTDPTRATELLKQAPQLAYAIFQALLLLNLVDTSVLTQIVETAAAAAAPVQQAPPSRLPPVAAPAPAPPPSFPGYPPQHAPTPPVHATPTNPPYAPPPPAQPQIDPAQAALYAQVMQLTPEQLNGLPPDQRNQLMQIRQMLMSQQRV